MARLGDIIEQIRGVSYKPDDISDILDDNSVILLRANNIQDGKIVLDDVVYVSKKKVNEKQYLNQGDILVCTSSGSKDLVGKAAYIDEDLPMVFGAFCKVIRPSVECSEYIGHFFQSPYYRNYISSVSAGANINNLRNEHISELNIQIPSLEEQRKIAAVLDKVSDLIAKRRQQLEKLDLLVKARFVEMFGDPVINPKGWEKFALGKRCDIVTGNTPSRAEPENFGNFIEWIKSDNINTPSMFLTEAQEYLSEIGFKKCRFVETDSLLMTCIAGSINCIGNVAVTRHRVAFNQQINAIVPKQDNVLYLYWLMLLSKPKIHGTINMALKGILSKGQLSEMVFPFPPIELQEQFATSVEQTEKIKTSIRESLTKLETLKKALMQEYFE